MRWGLIDSGRTVLRLAGAEVRPFLQGLVTNDVRRLAPERALYAALLTPQGKYLFDFIMVADGDAVLVDVAADRAAALAQRLSMYRLRKAVTIGPAGLSVALVWPDGEAGPLALPDPRHPGLGLRLYARDPAAALARQGAEPAPPDRYAALRVSLGVPDAGSELIPDETYILEAGFERLHGVDFRKGCYVGQEVTARMKHKTDLRKGLARVALDGTAAPGTEVMAGDRPAGKLHTVAGTEGLAHLRFDRTDGELRAGEARLRVIERL